jgi:hypothetical protein
MTKTNNEREILTPLRGASLPRPQVLGRRFAPQDDIVVPWAQYIQLPELFCSGNFFCVELANFKFRADRLRRAENQAARRGAAPSDCQAEAPRFENLFPLIIE